MGTPTTSQVYVAAQPKTEAPPVIARSVNSGPVPIVWGTTPDSGFLTAQAVIARVKLESNEKLVRVFFAKKSTAFVTFERGGILWTHILHVGEDGNYYPWRSVVECMEVVCG